MAPRRRRAAPDTGGDNTPTGPLKPGSNGLNLSTVFEEADRAMVEAARIVLAKLDGETVATLAHWIKVSGYLRASIDFALRLTNGRRGRRFIQLRKAWLEQMGCFSHPILKHKSTRSTLVHFTDETDEVGLREYWAMLDVYQQTRLRHPVAIWNRYTAWRDAVAGIAAADRDDMKTWWEQFDNRSYLLRPDSPEEPDDYSEEDDANDVDDEPDVTLAALAKTPFEEAVKRNPVTLWSAYKKWADAKATRKASAQRGAASRKAAAEEAARKAEEAARKARKRLDPDNDEDRERWVNGLGDAGEAALKAGKHVWQFVDIDSDGQLMWWAILTPPPDDPKNYPFLFDGMGVDDDGKFFNKCGPYDTAEEAEAAYAEWPEFIARLAAEEAAQGQPDPEPQPDDSIAAMMAAAAAAAAQPDPTDGAKTNGAGHAQPTDHRDDVEPLDTLDNPNEPHGCVTDPVIQRATTKYQLDQDLVERIKAAVSPLSEWEAKRRRRVGGSERVILTPAEVLDIVAAITERVAKFIADNPNYGAAKVDVDAGDVPDARRH